MKNRLTPLVLGATVAHLRRARGLSQAQLGKAADCSQAVVSRIEAGTAEPGVFLWERIARALGVAPEGRFNVAARIEHAATLAIEAVAPKGEARWVAETLSLGALAGLVAFCAAVVLPSLPMSPRPEKHSGRELEKPGARPLKGRRSRRIA